MLHCAFRHKTILPQNAQYLVNFTEPLLTALLHQLCASWSEPLSAAGTCPGHCFYQEKHTTFSSSPFCCLSPILQPVGSQSVIPALQGGDFTPQHKADKKDSVQGTLGLVIDGAHSSFGKSLEACCSYFSQDLYPGEQCSVIGGLCSPSHTSNSQQLFPELFSGSPL